jgi:hypothetical protein
MAPVLLKGRSRRVGFTNLARFDTTRPCEGSFLERIDMAEHRRGEMDIAEQKKTFAGFTKAAMYVAIVVAAILLLLTFRI